MAIVCKREYAETAFEILDVLEKHECTIAECQHILEIVRKNMLTSTIVHKGNFTVVEDSEDKNYVHISLPFSQP